MSERAGTDEDSRFSFPAVILAEIDGVSCTLDQCDDGKELDAYLSNLSFKPGRDTFYVNPISI